MYCNACGRELPSDARFCTNCGRGVVPAAPRSVLERPRQGRKIAGVCLAVANYLGVDVTLIRILWVLLVFLGGGGLIAYLVAWLIIPEEPLLSEPRAIGNGQQNSSPV